MTDIVDNIKCYVHGVIWDEAVMYKQNNRYYIQYIGLGKIRRISVKQYDEIKEKGYC